MKYESTIKPEVCPNCGSKSIGEILYGMPVFTPELEIQIAEGKIVLGGCIYSNEFPAWKYKDCKTKIYKPLKVQDFDH